MYLRAICEDLVVKPIYEMSSLVLPNAPASNLAVVQSAGSRVVGIKKGDVVSLPGAKWPAETVEILLVDSKDVNKVEVVDEMLH